MQIKLLYLEKLCRVEMLWIIPTGELQKSKSKYVNIYSSYFFWPSIKCYWLSLVRLQFFAFFGGVCKSYSGFYTVAEGEGDVFSVLNPLHGEHVTAALHHQVKNLW